MPRFEQTMSRDERDKLIMALHRKGWSDTRIAGYLKMSRRGVGTARERIAGTGREVIEGEYWASRPVADDW
jgi:hypothetical protein